MTLASKFAKSSFYNTLETVISIGVGFLTLPLMISYLGEEMYGLWILINSITASFYLFDIGLASAVTRFISGGLAKSDRTEASQVVSTAFFIYCLLAAAIVIFTFALVVLTPVLAPNSAHTDLARTLILITGLSMALEFPVKAYAGVAAFHVRYDLLSISRIFFKLTSTGALILALHLGYGVVAVATIGLVSTILSNGSFVYIAKRLEPDLKIRTSHFSKVKAKELFSFSGWTLIIDLSRMIQDRADVWIIGAFLSAAQLATYYVGIRLVDYAYQLLTKAFSMTTPLFTRDYECGDLQGLKEKFLGFTRLYFFVGGITIIGFFSLSGPFIKLWMSSDFDYGIAAQAACIVIIGKMLLFLSLPINSIFLTVRKPKKMSFLAVLEAVVSGLLMALFVGVFKWGVYGAALGITSSYVLLRPILGPYLLSRELDLSVGQYYRTLLRIVPALAVIGAVTVAVSRILGTDRPVYTIVLTLLALLVCTVVITLLALSDREKQLLQQILPPRIGKRLAPRGPAA